jgi:2Fe-2S ferredoxin
MVKITYVEHNGAEHVVEVTTGLSVMEAAVWNGVRGIYADCAGDGGCATCQIYVDEPWRSKLGNKSAKEKNTLRFAFEARENSRLACFIQVSETLDGLVVHMPRRQF